MYLSTWTVRCCYTFVYLCAQKRWREWKSERGKREAVRYAINPYWLKHHRKLFTVGLVHITLLVLTPALVCDIDRSSNVNCPAVCVCVCGHGGVTQKCSWVISPSSNHVVRAKNPCLTHSPTQTHTHTFSECCDCVIKLPQHIWVNITLLELSTLYLVYMYWFYLMFYWAYLELLKMSDHIHRKLYVCLKPLHKNSLPVAEFSSTNKNFSHNLLTCLPTTNLYTLCFCIQVSLLIKVCFWQIFSWGFMVGCCH